ncbi:MAG: pyruvate kinase [Nitrospinota bacterium]
MEFRRTKIVCTIGPASRHAFTLRSMVRAGMDVARLNFSHGTHAEHRRVIRKLRQLAREEGRPVGILQDLCGPKVRTGALRREPVELKEGRRVKLVAEPTAGNAGRIPVSYPGLLDVLSKGQRVILSDGSPQLEVVEARGEAVECRVLYGGLLKSHQGIRLPDTTLPLPALTPKDLQDMAFGVRAGVDFIALSFVQTAEDIEEGRRALQRLRAQIPLIAKVEKHEALAHIDEILEASDGVMVARGDLGIEIPLEQVPLVQKDLIRRANRLGKPVITATQMLLSMVSNPSPTRAEANDVANAILDGTDAIMLSEETAVGRSPAAVIRMMDRIARTVEVGSATEPELLRRGDQDSTASSAHAISHSSCLLADEVGARLILTPTYSGKTARLVARFRPRQLIVGASPDLRTVRQLTLSRGVLPLWSGKRLSLDALVRHAKERLCRAGILADGDRVVITAGYPPGRSTETNLIRVDVV